METKKRKSTAPFYAAAAVWLAYAVSFPLYAPLHYVLAAGAAILAFAAAAALCRSGPAGRRPRPSRRSGRRPNRSRPPQETRSWTR